MPVKKFLILFCGLALVMLACSVTIDLGNPPASAPTRTISGLDLVSTMVAQTFQAMTQQASSATPTDTPLPTNTPIPATLTVSADTNCYAGPSTSYGFVITLHPGTIALVAGKDTVDNYWIINVPNYPGTTCWLSGQYATVSGDTYNLVEAPTPAVPYPYSLSEPTRLRISCTTSPLSYPGPWGHSSTSWNVVFSWKNTDSDQTGVRVYRNGWRIATLGRNATSISDSFSHWWRHEGVTYGVQAFNSSEVSSIVTIDLDHCG